MNSKLHSHRDVQIEIRSILYVFQIFNDTIRYLTISIQYFFAFNISISFDDQTQVDSKPAGQPEHASLNHQCQLKAANRPELLFWAPPAGGRDKVSL